MRKEEIRLWEPKLKIDGTMEQLIDWAYRYDSDYSDEALLFIAAKAEEYGFPKEKSDIPRLVVEARNRKEGTLPYENMKIEKLLGGKISFSETMPYGEVEVFEDMSMVFVSISGVDDEGHFTAVNWVPIDEFMKGENGYLEALIGNALFYGKNHEEE